MSLAERRREERRAVEEAGGGESEGFELAEADLVRNASHGDDRVPEEILNAIGRPEEPLDANYGEADSERKAD